MVRRGQSPLECFDEMQGSLEKIYGQTIQDVFICDDSSAPFGMDGSMDLSHGIKVGICLHGWSQVFENILS